MRTDEYGSGRELWDMEIYQGAEEFYQSSREESARGHEIYQTREFYGREEDGLQAAVQDRTEAEDGRKKGFRRMMKRMQYGLTLSFCTVAAVHVMLSGGRRPVREAAAETAGESAVAEETAGAVESQPPVVTEAQAESGAEFDPSAGIPLAEEEQAYLDRLWAAMESEDTAAAEAIMGEPLFSELRNKLEYGQFDMVDNEEEMPYLYMDGMAYRVDFVNGKAMSLYGEEDGANNFTLRNVFLGEVSNQHANGYGSCAEVFYSEAYTQHSYYKGRFSHSLANGQGELTVYLEDAPAGSTYNSRYQGEFRDAYLYNGESVDFSFNHVPGGDDLEYRVRVENGVVAYDRLISEDGWENMNVGMVWKDTGWQQGEAGVYVLFDWENDRN